LEAFSTVIFAGLALWFLIWFSILLPYRMATYRKRDGYVWVAISIIGTPFLAIILLLIAGERKDP
jgi:hypothetical protein